MSGPWPAADRPGEEATAERRRVVEAVAAGDKSAVLAALTHPEDRVRASSVRGLTELGALDPLLWPELASDVSPRVRRTVAELGARFSEVDLRALLADTDSAVVEAACWAAGERGGRADNLVDLLVLVTTSHEDALCREAAVAALGAIGSPAALPTILAATGDRPAVRRRAVLALAPFDSPEVTAALERALEDRDWQVRQAAEDLL